MSTISKQDVKKRYKDHNERTLNYLLSVIEALKLEYTNVPESFFISLDILADLLDIYFMALDDIRQNGLTRKDNEGRIFKNTRLTVLWTVEPKIVDLLKSFALTPFSRTKLQKIKSFDKDDEENSLMLDNLLA